MTVADWLARLLPGILSAAFFVIAGDWLQTRSLNARRPRAEQAPAATLLLRQVHADLVASVAADVARQEGKPPPEKTLRELVHGHTRVSSVRPRKD